MARKLGVLKGSLSPIRDAASRHLNEESHVSGDGILHIARRPWIAPQNYAFWLYPGIDDESIDRYCEQFRLEIPFLYRRVLRRLNGAFCFGISLCGIPRSMLGNPPLLDRSSLPCHDLGTANTWWMREYQNAYSRFHFGGRHFSYTENAGYFIEGKTRILSLRKNGKIVGQWTRFEEFLNDELKASERLDKKLNPRK